MPRKNIKSNAKAKTNAIGKIKFPSTKSKVVVSRKKVDSLKENIENNQGARNGKSVEEIYQKKVNLESRTNFRCFK